MIEIRIDTDLLQNHQHNILHSIVMMDVLRKPSTSLRKFT